MSGSGRLDEDLQIGGIILPGNHARRLSPEEVEKLLSSDETVDFAEWDETLHPRDDRGRFISKDDLEQASSDPAKAAELRARVTDPEERAKLEAVIDDAGAEAATPGKDSRIPPVGSKITRTYKGGEYEVEVVDGGFRLTKDPLGISAGEKVYGSLTELAKEITGAKNINGVAWFGLGKKKVPGSKPTAGPVSGPTGKPAPKPKPIKKPKKGALEGAWPSKPQKLPEPDAAAVASLGFEASDDGWSSHEVNLRGPRAREALQVLLDNPTWKEDQAAQEAVLKAFDVRFGTHPGSAYKSKAAQAKDEYRAAQDRFSAVTAWAAMRAQGLDGAGNVMREKMGSNVNGFFKFQAPSRISISSTRRVMQDQDKPSQPFVSMGSRYKPPKHKSWTWGGATKDSTIVHEEGHRQHFRNVGFGKMMKLHAVKHDKGYGKSNAAFNWAGSIEKPVLKQAFQSGEISQYGSTHPLEFVAETWSRKCMGLPVSEDVMKIYRRLGGAELEGWK